MMLKKSISLLLCAVLAFLLCTFALPETALAGTPSTGVWVGGIAVQPNTYYISDGAGGITTGGGSIDNYIVYYATTTTANTLTLNGANISKNYVSGNITAAVYAIVPLTIELINNNILTGANIDSPSTSSAGIYIPYNDSTPNHLTINGTGTLTATGGAATNEVAAGDSYGIYCFGEININAETVNASAAEAGGLSCGIYGYKNIRVTNTTLNATGASASSQSCGIFMAGSTAPNLSISGGNVTVNYANLSTGVGIRASGDDSKISLSHDATVTVTNGTAADSGSTAIASSFQLQITDYTHGFVVYDTAQHDHPWYDLGDINTFLDGGWSNYFKIQPVTPSAAIGNVTVSGTKDKAIATQTATITITNNVFNELAAGTDVST